MRFFLVYLLAAALVPTLVDGWQDITIDLPGGLPDGSIHTFSIWHVGDLGAEQPVYIEFFNKINSSMLDDRAILAVDKGILSGAVASNNWVDGWKAEQNSNNRLDETPPSVGWWRVDVYKHDEFHMSVFLQGFWLGVREFEMSLNSIKTVNIRSNFMDRKYVQYHMSPKPRFYVVSGGLFNNFIEGKMGNDKRITEHYPNFPIGHRLEMVAVLYTAAGENPVKKPTLGFKPVGGDAASRFMNIVQEWTVLGISNMRGVYQPRFFETPQLYFSGPGNYTDGILCITQKMKPNGDLVHLDLLRTSKNVVTLRALSKYRAGIEKDFVSCDLTLPEDAAKGMDGPFDIVSDDGALLLGVEMKSN